MMFSGRIGAINSDPEGGKMKWRKAIGFHTRDDERGEREQTIGAGATERGNNDKRK